VSTMPDVGNAMPDVIQIMRVAESLGMRMSKDEATLYCEQVLLQLKAAEDFMRTRVDEARPPLIAPRRNLVLWPESLVTYSQAAAPS